MLGKNFCHRLPSIGIDFVRKIITDPTVVGVIQLLDRLPKVRKLLVGNNASPVFFLMHIELNLESFFHTWDTGACPHRSTEDVDEILVGGWTCCRFSRILRIRQLDTLDTRRWRRSRLRARLFRG